MGLPIYLQEDADYSVLKKCPNVKNMRTVFNSTTIPVRQPNEAEVRNKKIVYGAGKEAKANTGDDAKVVDGFAPESPATATENGASLFQPSTAAPTTETQPSENGSPK